MENNYRLLRIIRKNGLQVLSDDEQQYFWDNLDEFREEICKLSFRIWFDFPKKK